jgi:O-antigen/teichoic acid export membrane protein
MFYRFDFTSPLRGIIRKAAETLRLRAFDTSTSEGRSKERYRRVALTAIASGIAKCISILTGLITIPLTLDYLGVERYGLWMTISSVVLILGFADLGMGNGLLNAISEANGKDDREAAVNYVSSGFFMLLGVALLITLAFILAYPYVPWPRVFNIKSNLAIQEAGPAITAFVAILAVNLPLGVVQRVQLGYQEGYQTNLYQCLGSIFGLIGVLLVIYLQGGLPWLVLSMAGGPTLAVLINWVSLFRFRHPWLLPRWRSATFTSAKRIFRIGLMFLVLHLAMAFSFASDNLVAAQILGPEAVTQYSVPMRMFSILPMIMSMLAGSLWPAYGEAIARGELAWVRKTLIMSLLITFLTVALPSLFLVLFGVQIIHFWVGPEITPSFLLLSGMGIWTILLTLGSTLAMFLNGANIIRLQIFCASLFGIGALLSKIFLTYIIGLPGIVWGTVICYICFVVVPYIFYVPKIMTTMNLHRAKFN